MLSGRLFRAFLVPLTAAGLAQGCATGSTDDGLGTSGSTTSGSSGGGTGGSSSTSSGVASSSSSSASSSTSSTSSTSSASSTSSTSSASSTSGGSTCSIGHLLISQIRSRGAGGAADEFVELYNPTASPVTLDTNWKIEARSSSSTSYSDRWTGTGKVIPAYGHFLITGTGYTQTPASDESLSTGITDATSLLLVQGTTNVDAVCYGYDATTNGTFTSDTTYTCAGTPADNLPHDNSTSATSDTDVSITRKPGGTGGNCTDTGDNSSDFAATAPAAPMSTASPPTP
jgi:Lamin Tail Domain